MKTILLYFLIFLALASCKEKDDMTPAVEQAEFPQGIFVVNEGLFQSGTGSITYFNTERGETWVNVFSEVNQRPLGNVVQSMAIHHNKAYIVVNNAGKAEVVNLEDFKSEGAIDGLVLPRVFLGISNDKGYISQWGAGGMNGSVQVVNLETMQVEKSVSAGSGTDYLMMHNNHVLALNGGGFGNDSTMTVIDPETDAVLQTIQLQPNPRSAVTDNDGKLWILCGGRYDFMDPDKDSPGHLLRLHPQTYVIELDLEFPSQKIHPDKLVMNKAGDEMYFLYGSGIYSHPVSGTNLDLQPLVNRTFYSLGYDRVSETITAADAGDFISKGWVIRYLETGSVLDSFKAGVIPVNFVFNY
ncbi:MAG: DUF5074 domain-containing protein [Bacteroidia bacterium]